jgi:hypothetical protein
VFELLDCLWLELDELLGFLMFNLFSLASVLFSFFSDVIPKTESGFEITVTFSSFLPFFFFFSGEGEGEEELEDSSFFSAFSFDFSFFFCFRFSLCSGVCFGYLFKFKRYLFVAFRI